MTKNHDCMIAGTTVLDMICRPVALDQPIGPGVLLQVDPLVAVGGGLTCNTGIAMARMGMNVAVMSQLGQDPWADVLLNMLQREGVDTTLMTPRPGVSTSTTVACIAPDGERSFLHHLGPGAVMTYADAIEPILDQLATARLVFFGYYGLLPQLEPDMDQFALAMKKRGCLTAMDAAGDGGTMQPLYRILPHLDVYVPSLGEATHQTGETDPQRIIARYRESGATQLLGVKLGSDGVMISARPDQFFVAPICKPPGDVVDTTGAGDSFFAGLLTGLLRGMAPEDAAKLGTACAACSVTALGGCHGGRDFAFTCNLAGLSAAGQAGPSR